MVSERLFLLDGMALAYRAYYALISRPLINSRGENTSAIYGFINTLMKILDEEKPDYVAVVFDTPEPTFRHEKYEDYKATREKMPEDLSPQIEKIKDAVRAFDVPILEVPGYEADDVIGTLARRAEAKKVSAVMVTGDKDFMQLISPLISMYKPGKAGGNPEMIGEEGVAEKFGVSPDKVIEVLGLMGDSSDNIPGVPGIGPKTAIPLIRKFGGIPELYDHLEEIPQKGTREKLRKNRESALLSRELVTIKTDVPVDTDFRELKVSEPDKTKLIAFFEEYEFRTLINRIKGGPTKRTAPPPPPEPFPEELIEEEPLIDIQEDQHEYTIIRSMEELRKLLHSLEKVKRLALDTGTTSRDPFRGELVGISLCAKQRTAFFIPLPPSAKEMPPGLGWSDVRLDRNSALESLRPLLGNDSVEKVGQNIKEHYLVLRGAGIEMRGRTLDTMVSSYVLRPDSRHGLGSLAQEHLGYKMISYGDLAGTGKNEKHILEIPLDDLSRYAAEEADIALRIIAVLEKKLETDGLTSLCRDVEFPLTMVLGRMEFSGIRLDAAFLNRMSDQLEDLIKNLVGEIHSLAGESFNINSTQQLADILFSRLGLRTVRKTKTGFSTDAAVLESLKGEHPIIEKLLEYRILTKLQSTYVDALPQLVNASTGRIHTSFNQTVAATGRLASNDPNLQNIPIRTKVGRAIRQAFVPGSDDMVLLSADYSQIELRVMAHICNDPGLTEAFRNGEDIHATTASKVFGVPLGEVTPDMRRKAKEVNFGIMYGLSPFGLSNRLEISQAEAKEIISNYFIRFPKVRQYIHDTITSAKSRGYVTTLLGRRRFLPEVNSRNRNIRMNAERQAINMPIQGTAADMIKKAMILIDEEIRSRPLGARMLLQVHDELLLEVPQNEVRETSASVMKLMKEALPLSVPVEVEIGTGEHWLAAH